MSIHADCYDCARSTAGDCVRCPHDFVCTAGIRTCLWCLYAERCMGCAVCRRPKP